MAAEFFLTHDDLFLINNLTYDRRQIILLRLHHRQMLQTGKFYQRVSYKLTNTAETARFEPDPLEDPDIEEYDHLASGGRNMKSTGHRGNSGRPEYAYEDIKRRRLFE